MTRSSPSERPPANMSDRNSSGRAGNHAKSTGRTHFITYFSPYPSQTNSRTFPLLFDVELLRQYVKISLSPIQSWNYLLRLSVCNFKVYI